MKYFFCIVLFYLITIHSHVALASHGGGGGEEKPVVLDRTKELIGAIDSGDFYNIGGSKAADLIIEQVCAYDDMRNAKVLEIGSGYGAVASFILHSGFKDVTGVDINPEYIKYSKEHYPGINFIQSDVTQLTHEFKEDEFSFVYMINTAIAIEDKANLWQKIKNITKSDGILIAIDFNIYSPANVKLFTKPNGDPRYPILADEDLRFLQLIGWKILKRMDISSQYLSWCKEYVEKISEKRSDLELSQFKPEEIDFVLAYLNRIIKLIESKKLGAMLIMAKKV